MRPVHGIGHLTRVYGTRPVDPVERAAWLWAEQRRLQAGDAPRHPGDRARGVPDRARGVEGGDLPDAARLGRVVRPGAGRGDGPAHRRLDAGARHPSGPRPGAGRHPRSRAGVGSTSASRRTRTWSARSAPRTCADCRMPASTPPSSTSSATRPRRPGATTLRSTRVRASSPTCCCRRSRWRCATAGRARS